MTNSIKLLWRTTLLAAPLAAALGTSAIAGTFFYGGADVSQGGYFGYAGVGFRPGADVDSAGFVVRSQVGYGEFPLQRRCTAERT